MSALVSISCAAVLDQFPLVEGTEVHSDRQVKAILLLFTSFKAFLHLFMHKMRKSEVQLTGCWHHDNIILMLQKE